MSLWSRAPQKVNPHRAHSLKRTWVWLLLMLNMHQATRTCACFGFTLVAHTLRSIASLILRTSTQPTPVTLLLSRASSQCGLCGLVGRAADERQAWRQTWTRGVTVHSARSSDLCVKRTSPTLTLAARFARVLSTSETTVHQQLLACLCTIVCEFARLY